MLGTGEVLGIKPFSINSLGKLFVLFGNHLNDGQTITPFQPAASGKEPIRLISKDFAQLLVWSLLAGFSERLIPDRFRSIEETAFAPTSALK